MRRKERKKAEKLFKLFVRYMQEVEIPHLKRMTKIYDNLYDKILKRRSE